MSSIFGITIIDWCSSWNTRGQIYGGKNW